MPKRRLEHLAAETGEIRTASFRGTEHLVVPIVALVEGVVRPANSDGPELALASEFGHFPQGWNGRPVMVGHPTVNGTPVSAGDPAILESSSIGQTFKALVEDRKLKLEAWIDEAQARELGGEAEELVQRLQDGEQVEVSIGAFIDLDETPGEHNGKEFVAVWRNVTPDHLALLREGQVGACSIEMGCGAPRAASAANPENDDDAIDETTYQRIVKRAKSLLGIKDAISDVDRREQLEIALRDAENDFLGIVAVVDDRNVVYHAWAEGGGIRMFQRSFRVRGDRITLSDDKEEVRSQTSFVSVASAKCQCGRTVSTSTEGVTLMTKEQRIQALIEDGKSPWSEDDRDYLSGLSDDRLSAFEAQSKPANGDKGDSGTEGSTQAQAQPKPEPEPEPVAASSGQPPREKTPEELEAEFLAKAPESIRTMVERHKAADAKRKTELVGVLKSAQEAYTEDELNEMGVDQLERLVKVAKADVPAPDFSGRGVPREDDSDDDTGEIRSLTWGDFLQPKQPETAAN